MGKKGERVADGGEERVESGGWWEERERVGDSGEGWRQWEGVSNTNTITHHCDASLSRGGVGGTVGDQVRAVLSENAMSGVIQHVVLHSPIHRRYKPEEDPHSVENNILCGMWGVSINLTSILFEYCMFVLFTGIRTAINIVFASGPVTAK